MKKAISLVIFIFLLSTIVGFTNCGGDGSGIDGEGKKKSRELMTYLENKDDEGLKSMFCEITLSLDDFDEQVERFWEFFGGEIVSYKIGAVGGQSKSRDGKVALLDVIPRIENIETESGETFRIFFHCYVSNDDAPNKVGITKLTLRTGDDLNLIYTIGEYVD
ncbi:MAG: DUF5104 domain-containing protein [Oscillospiraceae bacterium]|nr:DUF5104 domain-containing protein [Oscillospiraceae bacterium]